VELSPDAREVYDEALGRLAQLVEAGLFGSEPNIGRVRAIGRDAARILAWRTARWPDDPPAVTASELDYHLARAELSDGHVRAARARLEASLASNRSREALVELARLEGLTGPPSRAVALYQEALDRSSQQGAAASFERAELLERLGDALRTAGDEGAARAAYTRALGLLRPLADQGEDAARALVRVRIGVLSLRTGAASDGAASFRAAIDVTPGWREPYLLALAHLVVGAPDVEFAEELHHRAQVGVALEPEWRVYFALWVQIIEGRAGRPVGEDVLRILREQSERAGWHGRLAAFGAGTLAEAALFEAATTPGERCEAAFYAGARKLVAGDLAGARALLTSAIDTGMVGYFELAMARELLSTMR
jgi:tetratricopeptide (TPR) repeat protein